MGLQMDSSELDKGLERLKKLAALKMYAETQAKVLEGEMKRDRPWTDRTADARKRLQASVTEIPNGYRINLVHGVTYGIWLELAHEKRFAILEPTLRLKGPEVVKGLSDLLSKL